MDVSEAQRDLRRAYVGGGPGVMVSGSVWAVTAIVQHLHGTGAAFAALFVGGMMIFPLSKLICRFGFRRTNEDPGNPLGMAALESTVAMIGGLFAAWLFLASKPALVLPLSAIAVGTHYAVFKTVYGDRLFWALAAVISAIGVGDLIVDALHGMAPPLVAAVELSLGAVLITRARIGRTV